MASDERVGRANVWRTAPNEQFRPMGHDIDQFEGHGRSRSLGLGFLWRAIYKRIKAVAALPTIAALAMGAIAFGQADQYVASSVIEIDPRQTLKASSEEAQPDAERRKIEAEIQALKSPPVLERAIEKLDLSGAADVKPDLIGAFLDKVLSRPPNAGSAADTLADRLSVTRLRNTFLVNVRLTGGDPAIVARVLNAIVDAYLEQKQSPFSAAAAHTVSERDLPVSPQPSASEKMFMEMLAQNGLSREHSGIRVIAKAEPPHGPAGPKRLTLTLAAFGSTLALAIALALLLERDAVSSARKDYVQRRLACHHVASLPTYSRDPAEITPRGARLVLNAPDGRYASAVHEIETEIKRRRSHDASRLILVVSALPREGAEELASNLAHSLAISGSAALLLDADLRLKPLTRLLAPQAASGLLDQIAARRPIDEAILRDQTTGLFFLPASGPAPTPLSVPSALRAPEFASAMRGLKHGFSTIVVAAPPALPVSDARIIADLADDIVFVTAWHRTPRRLAAKALASLAADQKKLLGAVLTGIDDGHALEPMSFAEIFSELRQAALVNIAARAA